jgi:hypothetical protein
MALRKLLFGIACLGFSSLAQAQSFSRWHLGPEAGLTVSRTYSGDTLPAAYSSRNKTGAYFQLNTQYNLSPAASVQLGIGLVNKGYKINNDTLNLNSASLSRTSGSLNIPLGLSLRQSLSGSSFLTEKFGVSGNFRFNTSSETTLNDPRDTVFRIAETPAKGFIPAFYLGFALGGTGENGNRYEFGVLYQQTLKQESSLKVESGEFWSQSFPLQYRGGFVQFRFTYLFDLENFKRSDEYFY